MSAASSRRSNTAWWERRAASISAAEQSGPKQRAMHRVSCSNMAPFLTLGEGVPIGQSRAQSAAGVPRRGLNPNLLERPLAQQPAIGHAIQRHTPGQAQTVAPGRLARASRQSQHGLLGHQLNGPRRIQVPLLDRAFRLARRTAKKLVETPVSHLETRQKIEIGKIQPERAVRAQLQEMVQNGLAVSRLAIRSQPHQFVFPRVDAETAIGREGRIQQAQRVRKAYFLDQLDQRPAPSPHGRRGPFPHPVHRQNRRLLEGRRIKRAGGVRLMVGREEDRGV